MNTSKEFNFEESFEDRVMLEGFLALYKVSKTGGMKRVS